MLKTYELIDLSNSVFALFIVSSAILILKMLFMSTLTSIQRFRTQTFSAPEDTVFSEGSEVKFGNENIERVRRAHRNDMENILPYLSIGLMYVLTDPLPWLAKTCFVVGTLARLLHSFVYAVYVIRQPARAICFLIHWLITIFFALATIYHFVSHL